MATVNYQFVSVCSGGEHINIDVSVNGAAAKHGSYDLTEIRAPLSSLTPKQQEALALLVLKAHFTGMTGAQIKSALQAGGGVTVTL